VKIKNEYCFITLNVDDGKMEQTEIVNKPRIRFMIDNKTSEECISDLIKSLRKKHDVQEIIKIYKHESSDIKEKKTAVMNNIISTNNFNYDTLIQSWASSKKNVDKEIIGKLIEINKKYITELEGVDVNELFVKNPVNWELHKLTFSNMFSYGENNVVDFTHNKKQVIGLLAFNGYGKSSIIDTLLFCLFDKCSRGSTKAEIVNTDKKNFVCQVEFSIGSCLYFIQRKGTRKKTLSVQVKFWKIDSKNKEENLSGKDRVATNKIIQSYIGTYEDFVCTCVSLQNNHDSFTDLSSSKRKEFMNQLLKIKVFDLLYQKGNEKKKEIAANYKYEEKGYSESERNGVEDKYDELNEKIKKKKKELESLEEDLENYDKQLKKIATSFSKIKNGEVLENCDISELKNKMSKLQDKHKSVCSEINELKYSDQENPEELLKNKRNELEKIYEKKSQLTSINFDDCLDHIKSVHNKSVIGLKNFKQCVKDNKKTLKLLSKFQYDPNVKLNDTEHAMSHTKFKDILHKYDLLKNELDKNEITIKKLNAYKYDPDCKFCTQNQFVIDAMNIKKNMPKLKDELTKLEKIKEEYRNLEQQVLKYRSQADKYNKYKELLDTTTLNMVYSVHSENNICTKYCKKINEVSDVHKYNILIHRLKLEINSLEKMIVDKKKYDKLIAYKTEISNDIKKTSEIIDLFKENNSVVKLHKQKDTIETEIESTKKEISNTRKTIGTMEIELALYDKQIETFQKKLKALNILKKELNLYKLYAEAMSKDGIPRALITSFIPILESQVNIILSSLCNFTIKVSNEAKDMKLNICTSQASYSAYTASGFEKFIINIAIRIVFSKLSCLSKSNTFIIDEMLSSMDNQNKNNITILFEYLKSQFNVVLIISHLEELKGSVDTTLTLEKSNGFSKINNSVF